MPSCHRRFLEHIDSIANIREYAMNSASSDEVTASYNLAVTRLSAFRDIHIQIVTRYIINPSNRSSTRGLSGTGGTELVPFLKQIRNETRDSALDRI
jgi:indoleamine 2,3-dioxygenase